MGNKDSLAVVMPVYNEEGAIAAVLDKWLSMLDRLSNIRFMCTMMDQRIKQKKSWISMRKGKRIS